jgi:ornithine carbamoyltransferase
VTPRHFLEVDDLSPDELVEVLDRSERSDPPAVLDKRGVALLFEKPSARTRNSCEVAVAQLGGHPVTLRGEEVGLDQRETVEDLTRILAGYHAVIGARVFDHAMLERMVAVSPVPVINLLSDRSHPLQALADLLTIRQRVGHLEGTTIAYVGDANNVCRSLAVGAALAGAAVRVAAPPGYQPDHELVARVGELGGSLEVMERPVDAAKGADVVCTDVWVSMGQDDEGEARQAAFAGYIVDESVMAAAAPEAIFLHCLPAHRGEEVAAEVIDGPASAVWQQAENRMHTTRGLLWWLT